MASIVETLVGDRRIQIGNESFSRQLNFGANWNRVRILFRISCADTGAGLTTTGLTVGLSTGATQGYDSGSLNEFIGCQPGGPNPGTYDDGTWARASYGLIGLSYRFSTMLTLYKTGSTTTVGANATGSSVYVPMIASGVGALYADITRNVGSFQIWTGGWNANSLGSMSTMDPFNIGSDTTDPNLWVNSGNAALNYAGNGVFDSLMIRWNKASPAIEISNVRVMRYY